MSSPLDRIEAIARASLGEERDADHAEALRNWTLSYPWAREGDDWLPYEETWFPLAHGVLALVAVARAAENHLDSTDLVLGDCDIAHLELTAPPLREALSRLGKDTAA